MSRSVPAVQKFLALFVLCLLANSQQSLAEQDLAEKSAAILAKHCGNCHSPTERQSGFSALDLANVLEGDDEGKLVSPGDASASRLIKLMTGELEPRMPPEEDYEKVPAEEIQVVREWINAGATYAHRSMSLRERISIPKILPSSPDLHFTSSACSLPLDSIALGSQGSVIARSSTESKTIWEVNDLAGKVNQLRLSRNGRHLVIAGGLTGVGGEALIVDSRTGEEQIRIEGHSDTIYCASLSPDQSILATGSYDRKIILWNANTGEKLSELTGHNGAVYDLDFSPDGKLLATASADQTVKLWTVTNGERFETMSQPEGEMTCVRFSLNGDSVYAGGADRQIRQWKIRRGDAPSSPMVQTLFAHEGPLLDLEVLQDGYLASSAKDQSVKLWSSDLAAQGELLKANDLPVAIGSIKDTKRVFCVDISGDLQTAKWPANPRLKKKTYKEPDSSKAALSISSISDTVTEYSDSQATDDCDTLKTAMDISLPAKISGLLFAKDSRGDADHFRFSAKQGEAWIFEVSASRLKSPVDSLIDILDAKTGRPVLKTRLQAVRESYFTFRGKDSAISDDFRLQYWEEMELDEYLYSSGEVTRLWLYPRGPDSGFKVYPGFGKRHTFFGSTAVSHALGEPAYIVRELSPDEAPLPNGLPVFPIYFENDDDPQRKRGSDSLLEFVAPSTGQYALRIRDARGFGGEKFSYKIEARSPTPNFKLKISGNKLQLPIGSGREWRVEVERQDGLQDPIAIEIVDLPAGFQATNPIIIEAGQNVAAGAIFLADRADLPDPGIEEADDNPKKSKDDKKSDKPSLKFSFALRARSIPTAQGKAVVKELSEKLQVEIVEKTEPHISVRPADDPEQTLHELVIRPGETVAARVVVERNGEKRRIGFGKEDAGRNLPHGAFVDKIGLNGLLIVESESERDMFITAAPKLKPGRRQFHLRADTPGNPTSPPIWIRVEPSSN